MLSLERWIDPLTESNCYLLGENGRAVVIDPNHPRGPLELLERLGWKPELILLTHEHCDHMAGLEALRRRWPGVPAAATAVCSANLQDKRLNMTQRMEVYLTFRGKPGVSYPPFVCAPAELPYERRWETVWQGHRLQCEALPGHTPGSAGIFLDGDTFFSGDYLIPGEKVILRLTGGSETDYRARTRPFLAQLPPGLRICPGHGAPYTLTGEEWSQDGL